MKKILALIWLLISTALAGTRPDGVLTRVDTTDAGDLVMVQIVEVDAPVERLWDAYTNEEDWRQWVTPVVSIDLRINGTIRSSYDPQASPEDDPPIVLQIVNYVPYELLTLQANISDNFPEFTQEDAARMHSVLKFERVGEGRSRLTSYSTGYRNDEKHAGLMQFFIEGNEMHYLKLRDYLESE